MGKVVCTKRQKMSLKIYADYYQFYFCEKASSADTSFIWDDNGAFERMLAVTEDFLAISTKRYSYVPVTVSLFESEPQIKYRRKPEKINQTHIQISTIATIGNFISLGTLKEIPFISPGKYHVKILYFALSSVKNDWVGSDRYEVHLWKV